MRIDKVEINPNRKGLDLTVYAFIPWKVVLALFGVAGVILLLALLSNNDEK